MRAIGLMSGTSCDGVDAVLLELSDPSVRHVPQVLDHAYVPFEPALVHELRRPEALTVARLAELHVELPHRYADTVRQLRDWSSANVVGMHGQTVWHAPPSRGASRPATLQIGSSGVLAALLELPVVGDLRSADMARGGEGAPIIPMCHWFFTPRDAGATLVINVGGIANYTYVTTALDDVRASDLGPGMMLTDALAGRASGGELGYDRDGILSRGGQPIPELVDAILAHPFFARPTPRSTGREDFGEAFLDRVLAPFADRSPADHIASTLLATAAAIERAAEHDVPRCDTVTLTGGGAQHPRLLEFVRDRLQGRTVTVASHGVLAPAHHEPAGMALIAARTLAGLPSALPQVTGADRASVLGHLHRP